MNNQEKAKIRVNEKKELRKQAIGIEIVTGMVTSIYNKGYNRAFKDSKDEVEAILDEHNTNPEMLMWKLGQYIKKSNTLIE